MTFIDACERIRSSVEKFTRQIGGSSSQLVTRDIEDKHAVVGLIIIKLSKKNILYDVVVCVAALNRCVDVDKPVSLE